mgnify:CR=1 FL=1
MSDQREIATLAGGCFWCIEAVFELVRGVEKVESGYIGGHVVNASYEAVCTGNTGHAEACQLTFDPEVVSYRALLDLFFTSHDPTTLNRQGGDVGPQYRSAIFYHSPEQKETAEAVIADLTAEGVWGGPIVTEITPFDAFYAAKQDHQGYYQSNGGQRYCQIVIDPKVRKLREKFAHKLKNPWLLFGVATILLLLMIVFFI